MNITNISIIGLGLIGGSIAASIKNKFPTSNIIAFDISRDSLQYAKNAGIIDKIANSIPATITNAELIIIAAPISAYSAILHKIKPVLKPDQIITDVASVKNEIIKIATKELGECVSQFVPGHPLAGSDKSSIKAAIKMLFSGCRVLLTPLDTTQTKAIRIVTEFWQTLGASVNITTPDQHDKILALTSHLPHVLSYTFMDTIRKNPNAQEILENTSNSFNDFTRIAASDQNLWADICLTNSGNIVAAIDSFAENLAKLKHAIVNGNQKKLSAEFGKARSLKQTLNTTGDL